MSTPRVPRKRIITKNAESTLASAHELPDEEDSTIEAIVPKAYKLTLDNSVEVHYQPGQQTMPLEHFAHWFSKAMGVVAAPIPPDFADTQTTPPV